jgi:hypothetical protein
MTTWLISTDGPPEGVIRVGLAGLAAYAKLASPAFTGTPTAPTAAPGTNTTQLATTAFVLANAGSGSVSDDAFGVGWDGVTDEAPSQNAVYDKIVTLAPLASPALTGTPTAPTAAPSTNTTQVATCAFVEAADVATFAAAALYTDAEITALGIGDYLTIAAAAATYAPLASPALTGNPTAPTPAANDNDTSIATTAYVQTELADYAPLASPALTGTPTAPTAAPSTNTTQVATCAYVEAAVAALGIGDYLTEADAAATYAPLASPSLTGTPTAPTAAPSTNTTQVATCAYVEAAVAAAGGGDVFLANDQTFTGANTFSRNGAASSSSMIFSGSAFTGGSGTTTYPLILISPTGATLPTSWSTLGTYLGINASSGFLGRFIDCHANGGARLFSVEDNGECVASAFTTTGTCTFSGVTTLSGDVAISNNNSGVSGRFTFSNTTVASNSSIRINGGIVTGGTGTSTLPYLYHSPSGATAATSWSTSGTYYGINAASGFAGNFLDFHVNGGGSIFNVASNGHLTCGQITCGIISGGSSITATTSVMAGSTSNIRWSSRSIMNSGASGRINFTNSAGTDFTRLTLGPEGSAYPELGSFSSGLLDFTNTAGANLTPIGCQSLEILDGMTAPSATSGRAKIYVDTADGDLKVIFGDGTIKTLATDT